MSKSVLCFEEPEQLEVLPQVSSTSKVKLWVHRSSAVFLKRPRLWVSGPPAPSLTWSIKVLHARLLLFLMLCFALILQTICFHQGTCPHHVEAAFQLKSRYRKQSQQRKDRILEALGLLAEDASVRRSHVPDADPVPMRTVLELGSAQEKKDAVAALSDVRGKLRDRLTACALVLAPLIV
jgi:hypothetical protein